MVHPGFASFNYGDDFNRSKEREIEMSLLQNPKLKQWLDQEKIMLVDWKNCPSLVSF